jgi:hypothetical protein
MILGSRRATDSLCHDGQQMRKGPGAACVGGLIGLEMFRRPLTNLKSEITNQSARLKDKHIVKRYFYRLSYFTRISSILVFLKRDEEFESFMSRETGAVSI